MGISTAVFSLIGIVGIGAAVLLLKKVLQPTGPGTSAPSKRAPPAKKTRSATRPTAKPLSPYRAISIVSGGSPCAAVTALEGALFLVEDRDAPELPLSVCDAQKCDCKYRHHLDRRDDDDDRRSIAASLRTQLHDQNGADERRDRKGRRNNDFDS